jgi:hypothetical protein
MADILNDTTDDDNLEQPAAPPAPVEPPPTEPELPSKFKGKTAQDIAKAYEQLEQQLGRQGQELGELRKTHDEIIRSTLTRRNDPPGTTTEPEDDTVFFTNPRKAIAEAVEKHPLVQELRQKQTETQHERAARTFRAKHPDAEAVIADPEFRAWVGASKVRQALLVAADRNYDVDAGDELLSTWKQLRTVKNPPQEVPAEKVDAARKDAVRAGTVPSGNAAPTDNAGKKIYRRADIVRLMRDHPEKYAEMGDEILLAYQEKRVR